MLMNDWTAALSVSSPDEGVDSAMSQWEDREEGVPPSKTTLCGEHDSQTKAQKVDQESSEVPSGQSAQRHQTHLDSIFMLLEENICSFVKKELKKIQKLLSPDYPECLESQREDDDVLDGEDEEQRRNSREAFLKITLHFLRRMKQEELADHLQGSKRMSLKI
ncbi:hypothetical protein EPR50_G00164480 [Perca flavescens]|uniref:Uncharacterized protein n=1 Tax=Perca flavescens TaxID=8167 RepID=A0A484CIF0_PERFV|nr:hypothetical protein EPR50_G00164480 [Perca flavescens]